MFDPASTLFPPITPSRHGMLAVDDLHTIYWEEVGNPDGIPVIFLHGGPAPGCRRRTAASSIPSNTA